jgi:hypothetical protein
MLLMFSVILLVFSVMLLVFSVILLVFSVILLVFSRGSFLAPLVAVGSLERDKGKQN